MARADPTATRCKREAAGRRAETAAALRLQLKDYRLPGRRARMPACEIDLVARQGRTLVFVEVKARRTQAKARESVTPQLGKQLEQAANRQVSRRHGLQQHVWRFDIVMLAPGRLPRHMRDAWWAQG